VIKRLAPILAVAAILVLVGCAPTGPSLPGTPAKPVPKSSAGCALVSLAEVKQISGVTFGSPVKEGPEEVHSKSAPAVTSTTSCSYKNSNSVYVQYFLDTINQPAAAYEQKVWHDDQIEEPGSSNTSVGGSPAFRMVESGQNGENFVEIAFYRGQVVVEVNTSGVPNGTAEQVAALVAKRM
jgi:hypothetical protein